MRMTCLLASTLLLFASATFAHAAECKEVGFGKCYSVRARYRIYADGDALWPIGTKRLLDTTDPKLDEMLEKADWQEHSLFGDFVVCPQSPYIQGHKQSVCIGSYKNLKLTKR